MFAAFDEAEYVRPEDPVDFDHESRSCSMLAEMAANPQLAEQRECCRRREGYLTCQQCLALAAA